MWPDAALYAPISLKCADSAAVAAVEQSQMQTAQTEVKIATHISQDKGGGRSRGGDEGAGLVRQLLACRNLTAKVSTKRAAAATAHSRAPSTAVDAWQPG